MRKDPLSYKGDFPTADSGRCGWRRGGGLIRDVPKRGDTFVDSSSTTYEDGWCVNANRW